MAQEIESRYLVPDRAIFDRLCRVRQLGEMHVSHRRTQRLRDTYLDTPAAPLRQDGQPRPSFQGIRRRHSQGTRHGHGAVTRRSTRFHYLAQACA